MDIKKLYADTCILAGEVPIYSFLTYCDICARSLISAYGEKAVLGEGEYATPASLSDAFAVDDAFYNAVLLFAAGKVGVDDGLLEKSKTEADAAYRALWRKAAKGKRIMGVTW
ncbi:MAG: hypothetical protein IJ002_08910 [Clostridia bacterium]|nr:hypothetical protein [Clostridia bacterium]